MSSALAKKLADKYILDDGSDPADEGIISDEEYFALSDRYHEQKARRYYRKYKKEIRPKEIAFHSFCTRVKREFMDKLVPSQQKTIDEVCNKEMEPLPTLVEYLQSQRDRREVNRKRDRELDLYLYRHDALADVWDYDAPDRLGSLPFEYDRYARIWRRIREDWGTIEPGTFEEELEQDFQDLTTELLRARELLAERRKLEREKS